MPQELINDPARRSSAASDRAVVRLKGGDPFVFGRGGEEAVALSDAGVAFEVVPGITLGGRRARRGRHPGDDRGMSAAVTVVTGHRATARRGHRRDVDWRALAGVGGTIVVLMGVAERGSIAAELIAGGLDPATPVAAVTSATDRRRGHRPLSPRRPGHHPDRVPRPSS